ncbi:hypothetical protein DM01DRAFT_1333605 [Hesseltinella vesiculosa]|uniref:Uncharacterized protein n=1 Tax=Hesseltinella vesiculosa TaxID=101127 RepID=A0A1X2GQE6_9FUNG|nr:hypothetical protein DM01DRAFT_1333605 [Hesseltinella vesiculosa]
MSSPDINEKVKRRLEMPQQMAPKLRARQIQVASWILSAGLSGYVVLFADFGPREHCFSPIRRWFQEKRRTFWTLSSEEQQDLKDQGRWKD